jgi:hypothetical protein
MLKYLTIVSLICVNFSDAFSTETEKELQDKIMQNYTVNLTWINDKLDPNQKYIFAGVSNSAELHEKFLNNAIGWSRLNPAEGGGRVLIWYDSLGIPAAAVGATEEELSPHPILLKDIRKIPFFSDPKNQEVLSDQINVYERADRVRVILSLYETENGSTNCFIFANCNMSPISKEQLFDPKSLTHLSSGCGLVMAHNTTGTNWTCSSEGKERTNGFENSFFMYSNMKTEKHQIMSNCLNYILVEGSIKHLKERRKNGYSVGPSDVFFLYGKVFTYYIAKTKGYTVGRFYNGNFIDFTEGNYLQELTQLSSHIFDFKEKNKKITIQIPTKDVAIPTTKSIFKGLDMSNVFII